MKKKIISSSISAIVFLAIGYSIGYLVSKKRYSIKESSGEIYIDYTEDSKQPALYLSNINPKIFNDNSKFIILGLNHIRK